MPTTYAHWRFGDRCIGTLPQNLQQVIRRNREIFDFGVHGPDIYFYYDCLRKNSVNQFGSDLHDIPFGDTVKEIRPRYLACDDKEAALAYLLGFTCHFALDSYSHGYIEIKEEVSGVSHGKLESQLDRYLLKKDRKDPIRTSVTTSLKPKKEIAHVISQIYPTWDDKVTYRTIRDMKFYLDVLKDSSDVKRWILGKTMDLAKVPSFKDLMLTKETVKEAVDAMLRLDKLSDNALEHYPKLAASLYAYLKDGTDLDPYFHNHFCPKPDYRDIPVLSLEEEKKYKTTLQD